MRRPRKGQALARRHPSQVISAHVVDVRRQPPPSDNEGFRWMMHMDATTAKAIAAAIASVASSVAIYLLSH